MKYSREILIAEIESDEQVKYLFFWGHQPLKNGEIGKSCLSQWWISDFEIDGITYKSAEHYMMAEKARLFEDAEAEKAIIDCETPAEAKKWGRKVKNFIPEKWDKASYEIVKNANRHKFGQNQELKDFLVNSENRVLVEASPVDFIWGIGLAADNPLAKNPKTWKGPNLLGFSLMEIRDELIDKNANL